MGGNLDGSCIRRSSTSLMLSNRRWVCPSEKVSFSQAYGQNVSKAKKCSLIGVHGVFMQEWIEAQQTMESASVAFFTILWMEL